MLLLTPAQTATLRPWFLSERPGWLVGMHVINTGHGACFVDRWPEPQAAFIATADNGALVGNPNTAFLFKLRGQMANFVEAPGQWEPALRSVFPKLQVWERVVFSLTTPPPPELALPASTPIRRLEPADAYALWGLSPEVSWIAKTWGGPAGLAASGVAWGAWSATRLVAVACSFFLGEQYEELGVVTEPAWRGQGLSLRCTAALCADIVARGHTPIWSTSPDNQASIRVAQKLGFTYERADRLYAIGIAIPPPPQRDASAVP